MTSMDGIDGLDGVEEPGEELHLVTDSGGHVTSEYALHVFITPSGASIQCIVVAAVEDRFLAVFPQKAWHRQTSKRVLPQSLIAKPTLMVVACCALGARDELLEEVTMKVWTGYITAETFGQLEPFDAETPANYGFVTESGSQDFLPFAVSLSDALQEHFAFLSAESGHGHGEGGEDGSGLGADLGGRVSHLENMMGRVSANMEEILFEMKGGRRAPKPSTPRVTFTDPLTSTVPQQPRGRGSGAAKFPLLDASVVAAAQAAGVSDENLEEMQRMMAAGRPKAKTLREPALRQPVAKTTVAQILSESEEEEVPDTVAAGSAGPSGPVSMEAAVGKLTELVSLLAADRVKKAKSSKVELALENLGSSSTADSSSGGSLKRASAARRALRQALQDAPEEISGVVERLLVEDLTSQTQAHGMPASVFNARAWVEHRSRIGSTYKTSAYAAWGVAGILDSLVNGKIARARSQAGLLLLQLDQVAIDRGSWSLAAELSLEIGPPLASLANHSLPNVADGESPFSRLLDPRWSEVMLSHLRDAEDYVVKRKALGRKVNADDSHQSESHPKSKAKPKGRAKASAEAAEA